MEIGREESEERGTRGERRQGGQNPPPPLVVPLSPEFAAGALGGRCVPLSPEFAAGAQKHYD